jgi:hypothetical protein
MIQGDGQKMSTGNRLYKLGRNKKQRTEPKFSAVSKYLLLILTLHFYNTGSHSYVGFLLYVIWLSFIILKNYIKYPIL